MIDRGDQEHCPLCGALLEIDDSNRNVCSECSFSFMEQDGVMIFDFRDLDFRLQYDKRFKDAIMKAQKSGLSATSRVASEIFSEDFTLTNGELKTFDLIEPSSIFEEEGLVFASFSRLKGRISGSLLMVVEPESLGLLGAQPSEDEMGEEQRRVMMKVGRQLTSAVCDRFAEEFSTKVDMTPPFLLFDMTSAIFNYIFSEFSQIEEEVDFYRTDLVSDSGARISIMFFPHPSTKSIFISSIDDLDD